MKILLYPILGGIALFSGVMAFVSIIRGFNISNEAISYATIDWFNLFFGLLVCMLGFLSISVCCYTLFSVRELTKENDKSYVASMFSNIVALVALIVALIALFIEVR